MKVEAILETPLNIVVTSDATRGGRHVLGRQTQPEMAAFSTACAVQNLWLAARAEGLGVGWVSFFDERELAAELGLPPHEQIVAYLCVGHVEAFAAEPELATTGWAKRRPLSWTVHHERWGARALPGDEATSVLLETLAAIRPPRPGGRRPRAAAPGSADQAARLARRARGRVDPARGPRRAVPAADARARRGGGVRRRPRGARAGRDAVAAGGHAADGRQLPGRWRGRSTRWRRRPAPRSWSSTSASTATSPPSRGLLPTQGPARHPRHDRRAGDDARRGGARAIEVGIETGPRPRGRGQPLPAHRRHGHRQHHGIGRADRGVHRARPQPTVTGRGTGIDDAMLAHKVEVVDRALALHRPRPRRPDRRPRRGRRPRTRGAGGLHARRGGRCASRSSSTA